MASNAVTVSQLPQTNTVISTDRIVVLYNASGNTALGNTSTRTIAVNNFVNSISSSILVTAPVANTSSGAFTLTLPASPTVGDLVQVTDGLYPTGWDVNNLTINPNGSLIANQGTNLLLNVAGVTVEILYDGTTWLVTATLGPAGIQGSQGVQSGAVVYEHQRRPHRRHECRRRAVGTQIHHAALSEALV